jgi:hypothetical protein
MPAALLRSMTWCSVRCTDAERLSCGEELFSNVFESAIRDS